MSDKSVQETVDKNPIPMKNCHMVGVKQSDGTIQVVKCVHNEALVGKTLTRGEWNSTPKSKVKDGIPVHALLQDVSTIDRFDN